MQLPFWVPGKEQQLISTQKVPAEQGHEKRGGRREKTLWKTKKRTVGQNVGAGQEDKGRNRKRLESLVEDRQTKMGCGSQNGSKWTVGISDCCSEACWFEAWSRIEPERKTRAKRGRGLSAASQTGCDKVNSA